MAGKKSLSKARTVALIILAVIEALFFGFIMDGWPSLEYMLKTDGVYSNLCTESNDNSSSNNNITSIQNIRASNRWRFPSRMRQPNSLITCPEQDTMYNTAYLISNIVGQGSAGVLGYIFDKYGLRISRIFTAICFLTGLLMLSFKDIALSWFIFPATLLLSIPSIMIVITTSHVAFLAGTKQATCVALISGCLDVSALAATFMQMAYDAGVTRAVCIYFYAALFLIHVLNTIFLSPKYKVYDDEMDVLETKATQVQPEVANTYTDKSVEQSEKPDKEQLKPFWKYAISPLYIMHTLWFTVIQLRFWYMLGSFNSWLNYVTHDNQSEVSRVTMIYGYLHFIILVLAPCVGIVTDYYVAKSVKENEEKTLLLDKSGMDGKKSTNLVPDGHVKRAYPVVFSLTVATLSAVALSVSSLFQTDSAAYTSSFFAIVLKGLLYASNLTFVQIVYPPEYHGKALGVSAAVSSLLNLFEEPLFIWAQVSDPPFEGALITLLVLCVLTLLYPTYIFIKSQMRS